MRGDGSRDALGSGTGAAIAQGGLTHSELSSAQPAYLLECFW